MRSTFALSQLFVSLILTFGATGAGAAMLCHRTHATGLSGEQIASRIDALIAQQIRMQQNGFSEPALFAQSRAYIENEKHRLSQIVPDFEQVYRDRYLTIRDRLKQKNTQRRQEDQIVEKRRLQVLQNEQVFLPTFTKSITVKLDAEPMAVSFSPDYKQAVLLGDGLRLIDVLSGKVLEKFYHPAAFTGGRFSSDGNFILASTSDGKAEIYNAQTYKWTKSLSRNKKPTFGPLDSQGNPLVKVEQDKSASLVKISVGSLERDLPVIEWVNKFIFNSDHSSFIMNLSGEGETFLIDVASGTAQQKLGKFPGVKAADFGPTGIKLVAGEKGEFYIYDVTREEKLPIDPKLGWISEPVFSPDGKYLIAITDNSTVSLIDVSTGKALHSEAFQQVPFHASFSPDGKRFFVALKNRREATIQTFDIFKSIQ